jgi:DNA-binding CsgD family transcriptional regulator
MVGVAESDAAVVGREHELAVIHSFVGERSRPAALVLDGNAGIGKTILWEAGVAAASAAGGRVLRCRPALAETQLAFAAVADLLDEGRTVLEAALQQAVGAGHEDAQGSCLYHLADLERRAGDWAGASRDALDRARVIFAALPAPLWTATVDDELGRLGIRSAPGGLTETEARVAKLAAGGMTNPEIVAAAFISRKTVEANLSKVYRKLGVRSRVDLARRLSSPGSPPAADQPAES